MGRDKAAIEYHGCDQAAYGLDLMQGVGVRAFLSVRADQAVRPPYRGRPLLCDRPEYEGEGPLAGILSAMAASAQTAWLVLACDLPFVTPVLIEDLLARRRPEQGVTAYASARDGRPEPLCAVYEPWIRPFLETFFFGGGRCARRFLEERGIALLDLPDAALLDNANDEAAYRRMRSVLNPCLGEEGDRCP